MTGERTEQPGRLERLGRFNRIETATRKYILAGMSVTGSAGLVGGTVSVDRGVIVTVYGLALGLAYLAARHVYSENRESYSNQN